MKGHLKNCPLCDSDRLAMMTITNGMAQGEIYAEVEIECFSCGTIFKLRGKSREEIIKLWNGEKLGEVAQ